jgi:hypothetical protein
LIAGKKKKKKIIKNKMQLSAAGVVKAEELETSGVLNVLNSYNSVE